MRRWDDFFYRARKGDRWLLQLFFVLYGFSQAAPFLGNERRFQNTACSPRDETAFCAGVFALVLDGGFDDRVCKDMWITRFTVPYSIDRIDAVTSVHSIDKESDVLVTIRNEVAGVGKGDRGQTALAAESDQGNSRESIRRQGSYAYESPAHSGC